MKRRAFLHDGLLVAGSLGLASVLPGCQTILPLKKRNGLAQATPESMGVSSAAIIDFIKEANACDFDWHSYMLLRHGKVIAQGWWDPFKPQYVHTLYSLSKSFTSTAVGFAIAEDEINLSDTVLSFFPESAPSDPSEHLKKMTVEHLLTMNTGHETDSFGSILSKYFLPWIPIFLEHPVPHQPGSKFLYDTGATFMLSAIVQKVVGQPIDAYLQPRLFEPLGIHQFDWQKSPEGICAGGFGLRVQSEALARFGQTYLNRGRWNGKQVIPEFWVDTATSKHTESNNGTSEWSNGYGYQFWRCSRPEVYRGDGAYGQYCIVMPEEDMVVAVTSESWDMGRSMQIIFDKLMPGISDQPLKSNPEKWSELKSLSSNLSIPLFKSKRYSPVSDQVHGRKYRLLNNVFKVDQVQFTFEENSIEWSVWKEGKEFIIVAGIENWHLNDDLVTSPFPVFFRTDHESKIAASASWKNRETLQFDLKMVEGIHGDRITFQFSGVEINISMLNSVAANDTTERNRERRADIKGISI